MMPLQSVVGQLSPRFRETFCGLKFGQHASFHLLAVDYLTKGHGETQARLAHENISALCSAEQDGLSITCFDATSRCYPSIVCCSYCQTKVSVAVAAPGPVIDENLSGCNMPYRANGRELKGKVSVPCCYSRGGVGH
jgi:hypothetical protein